MRIASRPAAIRLAAAVLAAGTVATALPAQAATVDARPARRTVDLTRADLGCTFSQVDTVNIPLDAVAAPTPSTVVTAGRAPAGGSKLWTLSPWGRDSYVFTAPEAGPVALDTAPDGTTVFAGTNAIAMYSPYGWTKAAFPAGVTGPTRSLAALPGGGAAVLLANGRVVVRTTGWKTLPAPTGTPLAVGSVQGRPAVLTVVRSGATQTLRTATWDTTRWTVRRVAATSNLPVMTPASTVWAADTDGGTVAINTNGALAAVVDMADGRVLQGTALAVRTPVTQAESLPGDRTLLAHAGPASGELSLVVRGGTATVPGTAGGPVRGLELTPGLGVGVVALRGGGPGHEDETTVERCR